jgi:hypothetical protein
MSVYDTTDTCSETSGPSNHSDESADNRTTSKEAKKKKAKKKKRNRKKRKHGVDQLKRELKLRLPYYKSDWKETYQATVPPATCFIFFSSLARALPLGAFLLVNVEEMGPMEVLLATSVSGMMTAVFAGQGMTIVGVSLPMCLFVMATRRFAYDRLGVPFLPFWGCVSIWSFCMHAALALSGACRAIHWVTRYAFETFTAVMGTAFIWIVITDHVGFLETESRAVAFLSLIITVGVFMACGKLNRAPSSFYFNAKLRETLQQYSVPVVLTFAVLVSFLADEYLSVKLPRIRLNDALTPTSDRTWVVDPFLAGDTGFFYAFFPSFVLTCLVFYDHNISSLMAQAPELNLRKPPAYNWDYFIVGCNILLCGVFGLPFTNAILPQSPLHVHALATRAQVTDAQGLKHIQIKHVAEQRGSNFLQSLLLFVCCSTPLLKLFQIIPFAAMSGIFLFMGCASFQGNGFTDRLFLLVTDPARRALHSYLPLKGLLSNSRGRNDVFKYTLLQFSVFLAMIIPTAFRSGWFGLEVLFTLCLGLLVFLRWFVLPRVFTQNLIDHVDGIDEQEAILDHMELRGETSKGKNASRKSNWGAQDQEDRKIGAPMKSSTTKSSVD